jgi:late competence protein required for DNA uptake (superfamily II DNA/RNA helicase)
MPWARLRLDRQGESLVEKNCASIWQWMKSRCGTCYSRGCAMLQRATSGDFLCSLKVVWKLEKEFTMQTSGPF